VRCYLTLVRVAVIQKIKISVREGGEQRGLLYTVTGKVTVLGKHCEDASEI
jgi:hypothetical protein